MKINAECYGHAVMLNLNGDLTAERDSAEPNLYLYKLVVSDRVRRIMSHASQGTLLQEVMMRLASSAINDADQFIRRSVVELKHCKVTISNGTHHAGALRVSRLPRRVVERRAGHPISRRPAQHPPHPCRRPPP